MPAWDFDDDNPLDSSLVSQFPANERAHRLAVVSWRDIEHSSNGRHKMPAGTRAARNALGDLIEGMWHLDTESWLLARRGASAWDFEAGLIVPGMMTVLAFSSGSIPNGWLACDGANYSTTTYAALFAKIGSAFNTQFKADGTQFADPGAGQFRVPDMRSIIALGFHAGGDGDGHHGTLGTLVGAKTGVLTQANLPNVNFPVTDPGHSHSLILGGAAAGGGGGAQSGPGGIGTSAETTGITVASGGSGTPVDKRQLSRVLPWVIKA